jgi:hypothetical protein
MKKRLLFIVAALAILVGFPLAQTQTDRFPGNVQIAGALTVTGGVTSAGGITTTAGAATVTPGSSTGAFELKNTAGNTGLELHIRPTAGKASYITFTENTVLDKWGIGTDAGAGGALLFRNTGPTGTLRYTLDFDGTVTTTNDVKVPALKKVYLDGGSNTYLHEASADKVDFVAGAVTRLSLNAAGSAQPGFLAYNSATDTAQASNTTVDFDAEVFDNASNFASDVFTAPVAGQYQFCVAVKIGDAVGETSSIDLVTTAATYRLATFTEFPGEGGCVVVPMAASETALIKIITTDLGGVDHTGGASPRVTWFSGRLEP